MPSITKDNTTELDDNLRTEIGSESHNFPDNEDEEICFGKLVSCSFLDILNDLLLWVISVKKRTDIPLHKENETRIFF